MRLNKPMLTIVLIIILAVDLVFFSLSLISNRITSKDFVKTVVDSFDFKDYLTNNDTIKKSIDSYLYPIEVFDYIDYDKFNNLKNDFIDNMINGNKELIKKDNIKEILDSSVLEYDEINSQDAYSYASADIDTFSIEMSNTFGNDLASSYGLFKSIASSFLLFIAIGIGIGIFIYFVIYERKKTYFYGSIILIALSYILSYLNEHFFENYFIESYYKGLDNETLMIDNSYIVCFILGFVLLLMYIVKLIRNYMRDMRIKSYSDSWR